MWDFLKTWVGTVQDVVERGKEKERARERGREERKKRERERRETDFHTCIIYVYKDTGLYMYVLHDVLVYMCTCVCVDLKEGS